jgi:hypothetical protein
VIESHLGMMSYLGWQITADVYKASLIAREKESPQLRAGLRA